MRIPSDCRQDDVVVSPELSCHEWENLPTLPATLCDRCEDDVPVGLELWRSESQSAPIMRDGCHDDVPVGLELWSRVLKGKAALRYCREDDVPVSLELGSRILEGHVIPRQGCEDHFPIFLHSCWGCEQPARNFTIRGDLLELLQPHQLLVWAPHKQKLFATRALRELLAEGHSIDELLGAVEEPLARG